MKDGKKEKKKKEFLRLLEWATPSLPLKSKKHIIVIIIRKQSFSPIGKKKKHYRREDSGLDASYEAEGVENVWAPEP